MFIFIAYYFNVMSQDQDYQCYNCFDIGYVQLKDKAVVAHCWCATGDSNKKLRPRILQAIRNSNFEFIKIRPKHNGPANSEEFWKRAEMWKTMLKNSEDFWSKNYIKRKSSLPYKDN